MTVVGTDFTRLVPDLFEKWDEEEMNSNKKVEVPESLIRLEIVMESPFKKYSKNIVLRWNSQLLKHLVQGREIFKTLRNILISSWSSEDMLISTI